MCFKWLIENYMEIVKQRPGSRSFPWVFLSCLIHDSVLFLPAGLCLIYLMSSNLRNNWSRSPAENVSLMLLFLGYVVKAHLHRHKGAQRDNGRVQGGPDIEYPAAVATGETGIQRQLLGGWDTIVQGSILHNLCPSQPERAAGWAPGCCLCSCECSVSVICVASCA